ncbi:MAG: DNA polymerase III subunit chi [Sneathiella sp.]
MTEVSFYHLQVEPLERALPRLLEKVVERGMTSLVRMKEEGLREQLDLALWTFSPDSFIAHGIGEDDKAAENPVLLTLEGTANLNNANVLVLLQDSDGADVKDFDRCLYMFDGGDEDALQAARGRWKSLKADGLDVTYWQQSATGWKKKA